MPSLDALILRVGEKDVHSGLPLAILTGTGSTPQAPLEGRLLPDLFLGEQGVPVYHEFNLASGTSVWVRFTVPLDVVIHSRVLTVVQGNVRFALGSGGTPSGVWSTKPIIRVNAMAEAPEYVGAVVADIGGYVASMVERDVLLLETGNNQAATVSQTVQEAGLSAGTYYVELRNTGGSTARGVYSVHWEERQPRSPMIY